MRREFYATYYELQEKHWWFVGRRTLFIDLLESRLPTRRPLEVLDFGCGTGAMLPALARFGEVTGVDADEEAVRFSSEGGRHVVHLPEGAELPFEDGAFDLVTALDVIEHIDDDVAALRELRRVVRPGGFALISVPAYKFLWGDQDVISQHKRRYTAKSLRKALTTAGFVVDHLSYFNTLLFPPIAAIRLGRRLLRSPRSDRSDFSMGGDRSNRILSRVLSAESRLVKNGRLPFGVSVLALGRPG